MEYSSDPAMKTMLETLLHEMVHAYAFVRERKSLRDRIPFLKRKSHFQYDNGHGDHFGSRISAVDERTWD